VTVVDEALGLLPCAERAEALGEDMTGTAPAEAGVLVIEQPGPWGRDAVSESGLRPLAADLEAHAAAAGFRIQVVRRATRRYAAERPAAWVAGLLPGTRFLERLDLGDHRALLDLDLDPGRPTGAGILQDEPLLLCCTHSTRDACCARRGLPLHRALTATGTETWHASHLGGHRFAATMAALPLGVWLGRVPVEEAADVVALLREGRLPIDHLRGRAGVPPAVQAAEIAVRRHAGLDHVDDLVVEGAGDDGEVTFATRDGRTFAAQVRRVPTGHARAVSCGPDAKVEDPGRFEVIISNPRLER
jgi:hypothetical protein